MSGSRSEAAASGGLLPTLLLVLFVALKLCGVIDWSWWWVLSPAWIPLVAVLALIPVIVAFAYFVERRKR